MLICPVFKWLYRDSKLHELHCLQIETMVGFGFIYSISNMSQITFNFCILLSCKINSGDCALCGEMCIICPDYFWGYKMFDLAEQPSPRGWQACRSLRVGWVSLPAFPGLPPTEGPDKGRNIPVDITIHPIICGPSITGRLWHVSYPFPQKILFSISSYCLLFSGF